MPQKKPQKVPHNVPHNLPHNIPHNTQQKIPQKIPHNMPHNTPHNMPQRIPHNMPSAPQPQSSSGMSAQTLRPEEDEQPLRTNEKIENAPPKKNEPMKASKPPQPSIYDARPEPHDYPGKCCCFALRWHINICAF